MLTGEICIYFSHPKYRAALLKRFPILECGKDTGADELQSQRTQEKIESA